MRPILLPSASAATMINTLFKVFGQLHLRILRCPISFTTSTTPENFSRPGLTMACRSLCNINQAVR
jgi:hypothetical protein